MKRNYFETKASLDDSLEEVLKHFDDWYKIFLEDAKRYESDRKDLDEDEDLDDDYDDEEEMDDAAFADFDRKHVSGYNDFQSNYDYYQKGLNMSNPYEDDKDEDSHKYFGVGFEINEPRCEDYKDRKKYEEDKAAFDRFVEAGKDCVKRGLEKPEWEDLNDVDEDVDDSPYVGKIFLWY